MMPVIADVPFPWRRPVKVVAPVPPLETRSGVIRVSAPALEKLEVAVAPKYVLLNTESWVVDAFVNESKLGREKVGFPPVPSPLVIVIWLAVPVKVLAAVPFVPLEERMPESDWKVGVPETMSEVVGAVLKYPVPEAVKAVVLAYGKVLAVEVVAVKYAATVSPTTESLLYGEVVPIPTLPKK